MAAGEFHPVLEPADIARIIVAQEDGLVMDVLSGVASSHYVSNSTHASRRSSSRWIPQRCWSPPERKGTTGPVPVAGKSGRRHLTCLTSVGFVA
ncbi:hypothetical protein [Arthrobacter oryzae]|uniref:hypothetical protein n=1 Tax=Arthrobacter oryzae TaxID=409290 RepID=UPI0027D7F292|nr:hypothetical protein [Arthrobacter oryzae]